MSDIMKVTTPPTGYENNSRNNPVTIQDTQIKNVVDPSKATRADGHTEGQTADQRPFSLSEPSNYDRFLRLLREMPLLSDTFSELLFTKMDVVIRSGLNEQFAAEIAEFLQMLKLNDSQLLDFVKNQTQAAAKFQGSFFQMLRSAFAGTASVELKTSILEFLKQYDSFSGKEHNLKSILSHLEQIKPYLPSSYQEKLASFTAKLLPESAQTSEKQGGRASVNLAILKENIIPLLGEYIGKTHNLGKVRNLISLLVFNTARYEAGSQTEFMQSLNTILSYGKISEGIRFAGLDTASLATLFSDSQNNPETTALIQKLVELVHQGAEGKAGYENKPLFDAVLRSFLLNESVYLPLLHVALPAEVNGRMFFSEMWVDPDAGQQSGGAEEQALRFFIKFHIKDTGLFELILMAKGSSVDMQLYYPPQFAPFHKAIQTGVEAICAKNSLSLHSLTLDRCIKPKHITEVFPKLKERKSSIDVKI